VVREIPRDTSNGDHDNGNRTYTHPPFSRTHIIRLDTQELCQPLKRALTHIARRSWTVDFSKMKKQPEGIRMDAKAATSVIAWP
jgi:hypothetical protein